MPPAIDSRLSRPQRPHSSSFAADERRIQRLSTLIFAELLPQSTVGMTTAFSSRHPRSSSEHPGWPQAHQTAVPNDAIVQTPLAFTKRARKEIALMKAYRTESSYYFSSRQLLPAGALVFFSDKHRRYIHPTAGTLLDPHPRLQSLSDAESQELEQHWHEALSRF
jgi:hypothetical protein